MDHSKIFFEKRASSVFSEYRYLTSDQKLAKSLERFSVTFAHTRAGIRRLTQDGQDWDSQVWAQLKLRTATFWRTGLTNVLDFSTFLNFLTSWVHQNPKIGHLEFIKIHRSKLFKWFSPDNQESPSKSKSPNFISDLAQMIRKCYKEAIPFEFWAWNTLKHHLVSSNGTLSANLRTALVMQSQSVVLSIDWWVKQLLSSFWDCAFPSPLPLRWQYSHPEFVDCFLILFCFVSLFLRYSLILSLLVKLNLKHTYENWIINWILFTNIMWSMH